MLVGLFYYEFQVFSCQKHDPISIKKLRPHPLFLTPRSGVSLSPLWTFCTFNSIILFPIRSGLVPNLLGYLLLVKWFQFRACPGRAPPPIARYAAYGIHRIAVLDHTPRSLFTRRFYSRFDLFGCPELFLTS